MPEPILIVEDGNTIRVTVGNCTRQGFDVEVAEDGAQALAMLKERSFSLILARLAPAGHERTGHPGLHPGIR